MLFITLGLVIFNFAKLGTDAAIGISIKGGLFLLASLSLDGMVATQSDIMKAEGNNTDAYHLMVSSNLVGFLSSLVTVVLSFGGAF